MTAPSPAERQAPPQISDEMVEAALDAFEVAKYAVTEDEGFRGVVAAVYPLVEAEVKASLVPTVSALAHEQMSGLKDDLTAAFGRTLEKALTECAVAVERETRDRLGNALDEVANDHAHNLRGEAAAVLLDAAKFVRGGS